MKRGILYCVIVAVGVFFHQHECLAKETPAGVIKRIISFTTMNSLKLEASFEQLPAEGTGYSLRITDERSGQQVFDQPVHPSRVMKEENQLIFEADSLAVGLWKPGGPRLYDLVFTVTLPDKTVQAKQQRIGFRFFEAKEGHLFLNGKPIFLRGIAINPPSRGIPDSVEKSRAFALDYVRYMKSIHVNIIRIPDNETWYEVCDELGMMVFGGNYSGTVMGEKPPRDYDKAVKWYKEDAFATIASHPSLMIYAMTNEVPFEGTIAAQWEKFLSYAHAALKKWDATRTYIANPGYGYGKSGDICDLHRYWGWYYCSPFTFLNIRNNEAIIPFKKKVQPITFTECVGNYTGPDGKYNLTPDHKNPGSQLNWTGHAGWNDQARLADEHQSFTFREATELFRRLRVINPELSGVFPFTILFYNWNNVQHFVDMGPKPVTKQVRLSYQPILLSWENWTSQVYAGTTMHPVIHIVNDDDEQRDLTNARLVYQLRDKGGRLVLSDSINLPGIAYYSTWQQQIAIRLPQELMTGNYQLTGNILLNGKSVSENYDNIFIGHKDLVMAAGTSRQAIFLYDPTGRTAASFNQLSIKYRKTGTMSVPASSLLVIGENAADENVMRQAAAIKQFMRNGGRVLCLRQDSSHFAALNRILPVPMKNITTPLDVAVYPPPPRPSRNGYYVNPERPDHPVFNDISREQLRVWSDYTAWDESKQGFPAIYPVTDGYTPANKKDIERIAVLGNYGVALEGIVLSEIFDGKGSLLLCGLDLSNRTQLDPVAGRMMVNLLSYMGDGKIHEAYPLVTSPIIWGDYASEKGILTGVNSGLMVNAVPRIPANNRSKITVTKEGNRFLGATGGFNTRPGVQYVAYGRRMYGPYMLRGFGNVPEPIDTSTNTGEGFFWCRIPAGKKMSSTLVWNQDEEPRVIRVTVNGQPAISKEIAPGKTVEVECPVHSRVIKMNFSGDRRLVLLQTAFK